VLEDNTASQDPASYRFIEKLLDPNDALSRYVRSLHVKSFRGDDNSYCMNTELLRACLVSMQKLDMFRFAIPSISED
jgi:hypothetical protein